MIDKLIQAEPQEYADDESMQEALDRGIEKYAELSNALDGVASPAVVLVLDPEGLHAFENISEDGDIDDLKAIFLLFAHVVKDEVLGKEGERGLEGLIESVSEALS